MFLDQVQKWLRQAIPCSFIPFGSIRLTLFWHWYRYGSSANLVLTTGRGVNGYTLDNALGEFILTHPNVRAHLNKFPFAYIWVPHLLSRSKYRLEEKFILSTRETAFISTDQWFSILSQLNILLMENLHIPLATSAVWLPMSTGHYYMVVSLAIPMTKKIRRVNWGYYMKRFRWRFWLNRYVTDNLGRSDFKLMTGWRNCHNRTETHTWYCSHRSPRADISVLG